MQSMKHFASPLRRCACSGPRVNVQHRERSETELLLGNERGPQSGRDGGILEAEKDVAKGDRLDETRLRFRSNREGEGSADP